MPIPPWYLSSRYYSVLRGAFLLQRECAVAGFRDSNDKGGPAKSQRKPFGYAIYQAQ